MLFLYMRVYTLFVDMYQILFNNERGTNCLSIHISIILQGKREGGTINVPFMNYISYRISLGNIAMLHITWTNREVFNVVMRTNI